MIYRRSNNQKRIKQKTQKILKDLRRLSPRTNEINKILESGKLTSTDILYLISNAPAELTTSLIEYIKCLNLTDNKRKKYILTLIKSQKINEYDELTSLMNEALLNDNYFLGQIKKTIKSELKKGTRPSEIIAPSNNALNRLFAGKLSNKSTLGKVKNGRIATIENEEEFYNMLQNEPHSVAVKKFTEYIFTHALSIDSYYNAKNFLESLSIKELEEIYDSTPKSKARETRETLVYHILTYNVERLSDKKLQKFLQGINIINPRANINNITNILKKINENNNQDQLFNKYIFEVIDSCCIYSNEKNKFDNLNKIIDCFNKIKDSCVRKIVDKYFVPMSQQKNKMFAYVSSDEQRDNNNAAKSFIKLLQKSDRPGLFYNYEKTIKYFYNLEGVENDQKTVLYEFLNKINFMHSANRVTRNEQIKANREKKHKKNIALEQQLLDLNNPSNTIFREEINALYDYVENMLENVYISRNNSKRLQGHEKIQNTIDNFKNLEEKYEKYYRYKIQLLLIKYENQMIEDTDKESFYNIIKESYFKNNYSLLPLRYRNKIDEIIKEPDFVQFLKNSFINDHGSATVYRKYQISLFKGILEEKNYTIKYNPAPTIVDSNSNELKCDSIYISYSEIFEKLNNTMDENIVDKIKQMIDDGALDNPQILLSALHRYLVTHPNINDPKVLDIKIELLSKICENNPSTLTYFIGPYEIMELYEKKSSIIDNNDIFFDIFSSLNGNQQNKLMTILSQKEILLQIKEMFKNIDPNKEYNTNLFLPLLSKLYGAVEIEINESIQGCSLDETAGKIVMPKYISVELLSELNNHYEEILEIGGRHV